MPNETLKAVLILTSARRRSQLNSTPLAAAASVILAFCAAVSTIESRCARALIKHPQHPKGCPLRCHRSDSFVHALNRGDQHRSRSASNQLNGATMSTPSTMNAVQGCDKCIERLHVDLFDGFVVLTFTLLTSLESLHWSNEVIRTLSLTLSKFYTAQLTLMTRLYIL